MLLDRHHRENGLNSTTWTGGLRHPTAAASPLNLLRMRLSGPLTLSHEQHWQDAYATGFLD